MASEDSPTGGDDWIDGMDDRRKPQSSRRPPLVGVWEDLGTWARVSIAGIVVAGILALALGFFITRQVEQRFLEAEIVTDQQVLDFLMATEAISSSGQPDPEILDHFFAPLLESGAIMRVKLWSPDGTILYSDERRLVGRRFVIDEDLPTLLAPFSHIADLSAEENQFEQGLADEALETYVPVLDGDQVLAVWEVYRPLDEFRAAAASTRWTVFLTVGGGLLLLGVFLVSAFGALVAAALRRRNEAEERSADLVQLLELAQIAAQHHHTDDLAAAAADHLYERGIYDCVRLVHHPSERPQVVLATAGICICVDAPERKGPFRRPVSVVTHNGELELIACGDGLPEQDVRPLLEGALEELRVGLQKASLYEDLEANRAQLEAVMDLLVTAQDDERRRLVADIHDGLAQDLYRVLFGIRGCMTAEGDDLQVELSALETLVERSSKQLRALLQTIHPSVVEDVGLGASLQTLAEQIKVRYGLTVATDLERCPEPGFEARLAAYRITQEALVNVAKHAAAGTATVSAIADNGDLLVTILDDGVGISRKDDPGLGLWLMRERSERLGGSVAVTAAGTGTKVVARLPLRGTE